MRGALVHVHSLTIMNQSFMQSRCCVRAPVVLAQCRGATARLSTRTQASATSVQGVEAAVQALAAGQPVAILDAADREGETDIFFPAINMKPEDMRFLRRQAGGEMYVAIAHEIAQHFGLMYVSDVFKAASGNFPVLGGMDKYTGDMCQGRCSVGLSFDHRQTHTGAPDDERSFTVRRFAELYVETLQAGPGLESRGALGKEFHIPGHIFFCIENELGIAARTGHSDLSVALARLAGVVPVMVGCVMLENDSESFGAVSPARAEAWCAERGVPFVTGKMVVDAVNKSKGL